MKLDRGSGRCRQGVRRRLFDSRGTAFPYRGKSLLGRGKFQICQMLSVRPFLIGDLRGYTRFIQQQGDEAAERALAADVVRDRC